MKTLKNTYVILYNFQILTFLDLEGISSANNCPPEYSNFVLREKVRPFKMKYSLLELLSTVLTKKSFFFLHLDDVVMKAGVRCSEFLILT